nr:MAG TPA: hypothetical protein [Caudoviricetes sp.]
MASMLVLFPAACCLVIHQLFSTQLMQVLTSARIFATSAKSKIKPVKMENARIR